MSEVTGHGAFAGARYTVYCSRYVGRRYADRVIRRGMSWVDASALAEKMQERERARHEHWSSWTGRLFGRELENPEHGPQRADGKPPRKSRLALKVEGHKLVV